MTRHSYLTVSEVAEVLGLTRQQVHNLRKSGTLRAVRREVFLAGDVEKLARLRAERAERRQRKRAIRARVRKARREILEEAKSDAGGIPGAPATDE